MLSVTQLQLRYIFNVSYNETICTGTVNVNGSEGTQGILEKLSVSNKTEELIHNLIQIWASSFTWNRPPILVTQNLICT